MTESAAAKPKAGAGADPADQQAAQRRTAGEGDGARELDARVGGRQRSAAAPARAPATARRRCRRRCRTPRRSRAAASSGSGDAGRARSAPASPAGPPRAAPRRRPSAGGATGGRPSGRPEWRTARTAGSARSAAGRSAPSPAPSSSTATIGAAASATCSADCAARLDQASRLKVGGSLSCWDEVIGAPGLLARKLGSLRRPLYPRAAAYCSKADDARPEQLSARPRRDDAAGAIGSRARARQ